MLPSDNWRSAGEENDLDEEDLVFQGSTDNERSLQEWRDREQRQRSLRVMMMFLLMLLLSEEEKPPRLMKKKAAPIKLEKGVWNARQRQDELLDHLGQQHPRYQALVQKNEKDMDRQIREIAQQELGQSKDEFASELPPQHDPEGDRKVYHYPWNMTGFYRGEWKKLPTGALHESLIEAMTAKSDAVVTIDANAKRDQDPRALEGMMQTLLRDKHEAAGVFLLPDGYTIKTRDDHNLTSMSWEEMRVDAAGREFEATPREIPSEPKVTLTHDSGRVAFQLVSRTIPTMHEISIVDGFVKLYDSISPGYSTRKDVLLRVRGVLLHSIGKLSLVSSHDIQRSALAIDHASRRRLRELLENEPIETARDHALQLDEKDLSSTSESIIASVDLEESVPPVDHGSGAKLGWSETVIPYPFVPDDADELIRKVRTQAFRRMPAREQDLEANALGCEFEISLDVDDVEWTVGSWKKMLVRHNRKTNELNPFYESPLKADSEEDVRLRSLRGRSPSQPKPDQAVAMHMFGSIQSPNCDFTAQLNVTALRTDWDATTSKVINYSFFMMVVCLAQIVILLRQLLHSQAQSTAIRVSILCIGWQAVIDALVCLAHIYLSLSLQPLFTAFASVAFFKLLIFCVIEMKYMSSTFDLARSLESFDLLTLLSYHSSTEQQQWRANNRGSSSSGCDAPPSLLRRDGGCFPLGVLHR